MRRLEGRELGSTTYLAKGGSHDVYYLKGCN
jgi:hypothetical protein